MPSNDQVGPWSAQDIWRLFPTPPRSQDVSQLAQDKTQWRRYCRMIRRQLPATEKTRRDKLITDRAVDWVRTHKYSRIAAFIPLPSEPGAGLLLDALVTVSTQVYLPISGPAGQLFWGKYQPGALTPGAMGILEPAPITWSVEDSAALLESLDALIVPALAATPEGHRLGQGAGYYDRALAECPTPQLMLLYSHEIHPDVPHGTYDIQIPHIIHD